jgi:hypothetical protein
MTMLDPRYRRSQASNREKVLRRFDLDPKGDRSWIQRGGEMAEATVIEEQVEEREPQWELAECTCPDWCERDHEQD